MATFFTHAFVGSSLIFFANKENRSWKNYIIAAFIAVSPDFDIISFRLGIPYDSLFGHRGITHSLISALILALIGFLISINFNFKNIKNKYIRLLPFFILASLSHGVLDAFTNGGHGVAFFAPFIENRYFFSIQPIEVCKIGMNFFNSIPKLMTVLKSEFLYAWLPFLVLILIVSWVRDTKRPSPFID